MFFISLCCLFHAQDVSVKSPIFAALNFSQFKESANFGLVYWGPGVEYGMRWERTKADFTKSYDFKLGLALLTAKETLGGNLNLKPFGFTYLRNVSIAHHDFRIGGALKGEYNWQIYSELQRGYDYWLTNYCTGLVIRTAIPIRKSEVDIRFFNNLIGMVSRNQIYNDPYFFDLNFQEVVSDLHQDFRFATLDSFDNSVLEITYLPRPDSKFTMSYILDYNNYYRNPKLETLTQSIRFNFN